MMMTIVGPHRLSDGCWNGLAFTPRVTISRQCTSVVMPFASAVMVSASSTPCRSMPISSDTALQLSNSRSMCASKKAHVPL